MTGCDPAVGVEERNVVVHEIEMTVPLGLKFLKKVWQLDLRGQVLVDSSLTVSRRSVSVFGRTDTEIICISYDCLGDRLATFTGLDGPAQGKAKRKNRKRKKEMEMRGIEPRASRMQSERSTI